LDLTEAASLVIGEDFLLAYLHGPFIDDRHPPVETDNQFVNGFQNDVIY